MLLNFSSIKFYTLNNDPRFQVKERNFETMGQQQTINTYFRNNLFIWKNKNNIAEFCNNLSL